MLYNILLYLNIHFFLFDNGISLLARVEMITLYNVCSVHWGMFSTSGDVQYIGGCSVHRGDIMSTSGGYHEYIGGYHEYIGGCSVHWRDTMSISGGVQYIRGIP